MCIRDRNVNALAVGGNRPLSTSREKLRQMEQERMPLYQKYSDIEINNDTVFKLAVQKVKEAVSYTHLDVYKRQLYRVFRDNDFTGLKRKSR